MAVIASATGAALTGGALAAGSLGAGLLGGAVLGAGAGALYSGITGDGDVLNSALTGGLIGGAVGGIGAAAFGTPATLSAVPTATGGASPALVAAQNATAATSPAQLNAIAAAQGAVPELSASLPGAGLMAAPSSLPATIAPATVGSATSQLAAVKPATTGMDMLGYGLAGTAALSLLGGMNQKKLSGTDIPGQNPAMIRPFTYNVSQNQSAYPTTPQYGSNGLPILPTSEKSYFNQSYTAGTPYKAAAGGLMSSPVPGMMQSGPADVNFMGNDMYPTSQQHRAFYATPTQMPTSAQEVMASYEPKINPLTGQMMKNMADGGIARFKSGGDDNFDSANYNASLSLADMKKIRKRAIMDRQEMEDEARKEIMLDLIASPLTPKTMPGANVGSDNAFEKYMMTSQTPTGAFGRVGASKELDNGARIRAGASGTAMAIPGKHGITAMPQALDIGYTSARKSEEDPYYDLSAFRSIDPIPGKGHAQGVNARYTMPFADGGITYDAATQTYKGLPSIGGGPAVEIPILDAPPAAAAAQANSDPFSMFGGFGPMAEIGMGEQAAPVGSDQFTPATSLYKNELGDLTSQWQAANPHAKSYNAADQTYGAGKPTNAQLLAIKNAQAQQAYNDRLSAYQGYAAGGGIESAYNLGSYSDGGRLLKGPGDGVSDDIPAVIGNKQPARLADGEFVIPARIVSEIGNGSTDAGAKRLYAMMDKIQEGRKKTIGKKNVAKDTKAKKHLLG